eukprot:CAMPEP_0175150218 /NCGR_PEP_ID=MMETSP0087-20121206/17737_1 /TAXON_ID=136419 /ORGANISM="Unknown Unknown, Strain D1" /LENGTH=517 /DNA_ID=CAMNT_0016436117 /DNA_START=12 /DNA_END=1565 /DNA_ORIENTATION=+
MAAQLSLMKAAACSGFSSAQLSNLEGVSPYSSCSGFTAECVNSILPTENKGFGLTCVSHMPDDALSLVDDKFVAGLSNGGASGIMAAQLSLMKAAACSGFSSAQLSNLEGVSPYSSCSGFTAECVNSILPTENKGFGLTCVSHMPDDALSLVDDKFVAGLSNGGASGIMAAQLSLMKASACSGFSSAQLSNLGGKSPYNTCAGFLSGCISNVADTSVSGFGMSCTMLWSDDATRGMKASQLPGLTPSAVGGFRGSQFLVLRQAFNQTFVNGLSIKQCAGSNPISVSTFKKYYADATLTPATVLSDLSVATLFQLTDCTDACKPLLASTANTLPNSSFMGLRADQVASVGLTPISQLTSAQSSNWLSDAIGALSADQVAQFTPSAFAALSLGAIPAPACAGITPDQIVKVPVPSLHMMACDQFLKLAEPTLAALNQVQPSVYNQFVKRCGAPAPTPPTAPTAPTAHTTPVPTPGEPPSKPSIVGPVIGGVGGGLLLGVGGVLCFMKRRRRSLADYQPM